MEAKERPKVDWFLLTVHRLHPDLPDGWKWYSFRHGLDKGDSEVPPDTTRLRGCVPDGVYVSGKRKGEPRWSNPIAGTDRTLWIPTKEINESMRLWEIENQKCCDCVGTGQSWDGWNRETGVRYAPCKRCNATGRPSKSDAA